jgi:hypothetical protein
LGEGGVNVELVWMDRAACAGRPEVFDAGTLLYDVDTAKDICAGCTTLEECRSYSDETEPGQGFPGYADMIVAGETARERWERRWGKPRPARTSDRIRAMGVIDHIAPWQERGGIRENDPGKLPGSDKGFTMGQVQLMTGLTQRQVRYLSQKGVGAPLPGKPGVAGRWTVAHIDQLRAVKDRLDEGQSMQRARAEVLAMVTA